MPTLKINEKEVTVEKGTTLIQAAEKLGYEIPHYCYHPGLSIAGNCRMCLVEVEKMPKLQISCHIQCQDGMVVRTETEKVKKTRQHVLEFLLVNHPLDCPVCDQAGECGLQNYYMEHGRYDSRLNEPKIKKKKAVPIGPHVILDSERCILCSRCVRFCDEVTKTGEFGIFNRGDHSEIGLYPGKELTNNYSGNVVDICPVGALTDRDFRFKCRVWYLKKAESVCNGCARGCNISIEVNAERPQHGHGERVMRIKPRYQPEVNKWWICDEGRYGYKSIDHGRLMDPVTRNQDKIETISWTEMISSVAGEIERNLKSNSKIAVLLSPQLSNEALFAAKKLFVKNLKLQHVYLASPNKPGAQDDILLRADKNPNRKGAEIFGFIEDENKIQNVLELAKSGAINVLYLFGQDLISLKSNLEAAKALKKINRVIFQGTNVNLTSEQANLVIPSASYAESEGTFTNFEGKVQAFDQALFPIGSAKSDVEILTLLANQLGFAWPDWSLREVGDEMRNEIPELRNVLARVPDEEPYQEEAVR